MTEGQTYQIPFGSVSFGDLKRFSPISHKYGLERGTPIDRYYIEGFLSRNAGAVRGRVLELADNNYTKRFGGTRVEQSDVLSLKANNLGATIVGDLTQPGTLPAMAFDCIILTQALQYFYDTRYAIEMLYRALKPHGVLLVTVPGITRLDVEPWYWSFTALALHRLLEDSFGQNSVESEAHGNIFAATAFLYGLAVEELNTSDLDVYDQNYPVTVAARGIKRQAHE
jgi:SAM-dependent methyltransferase